MRRPWIALLLALVAGAGLIAYEGARRERDLTMDLGVLPAGVVATLGPGDTACQTPVGVADPLRQVGLWLGPINYPRGPMEVTLRRGDANGPVLARAERPMRPIGGGWTILELDREVPEGIDVGLCVENHGENLLEILGDFDTSSGLAPPKRFAGRVLNNPTRSTDGVVLNGTSLDGVDMAAIFPMAEPQSLLERLPQALSHASRFKPDLVGAWTYWALLALALTAAPFALSRALRAAHEADEA